MGPYWVLSSATVMTWSAVDWVVRLLLPGLTVAVARGLPVPASPAVPEVVAGAGVAGTAPAEGGVIVPAIAGPAEAV